jgi:hypothetical protein
MDMLVVNINDGADGILYRFSNNVLYDPEARKFYLNEKDYLNSSSIYKILTTTNEVVTLDLAYIRETILSGAVYNAALQKVITDFNLT